jgi:predicted XRE-type DNA-binding protein
MTDSIADRRTRILEQIVERVRSWPMSKSGRAALIGVTEAQLDDLLAGRFEDFTLDQVARIGTLTGVMVIF